MDRSGSSRYNRGRTRGQGPAVKGKGSPEQVCELVPGLSVAVLKEMRAWRRAGMKGVKAGPAYSQPSRTAILYRADDVFTYLDSIAVK